VASEALNALICRFFEAPCSILDVRRLLQLLSLRRDHETHICLPIFNSFFTHSNLNYFVPWSEQGCELVFVHFTCKTCMRYQSLSPFGVRRWSPTPVLLASAQTEASSQALLVLQNLISR
jgi:hypothetical protein